MSSHNVFSQNAKMKGYGLVRDKYGRPKVDDPDKLPNEVKQQLTKEDWEYLNGTHAHDNN